MIYQTIETLDDLNRGLAHLAGVEPRFSEAIDIAGPLPLRRKAGEFSTLLETIVSQQLSVASASAILQRMEDNGLNSAESISNAAVEHLRSCGLSRQKIRYAKALSAAKIDFVQLRSEPDNAVVKELMSVAGIGKWTAEIYLMFVLGRQDVIAAGDLALQEATRLLFDLHERPSEKELRSMSEAWRPWRSVAATLLWGYYRAAKKREGVIS